MSKRLDHPTPSTPLAPVRPPFRVLLLYALGQLGWSLGSYGVTNLLIYFYMPPEKGEPVFPSYVFQGAILGILTLIGIVSAAGRFFDAVIDPFIANWSDRKESPQGRRRWFMRWGAIPLALSSYLVFFPLNDSESASNFVWLLGMISVYYFCFAFYVIPYTALIAELGHTPKDRMLISTLVSITWALGFVGGTQVYALQSYWVGQGETPIKAFHTALGLLSLAAMIFMMLPALFLNEKKYTKQSASEHNLWKSLRSVIGNSNFRAFLWSDLFYWIALNFIQLGIGFYTTLLLGLDVGYASLFSVVSFVTSFLFYAPVNWMAVRFGKKRLLLAAFWVFAILYALVGSIRALPASPEALLYGLGILAGFPLAAFGILPNALIGDVAVQEEQRSGQSISGMFFGVRAFVMKVGISLANLIFPSLLLFGKSTENAFGVQLTAFAAVAFCIAGWSAFRRFEE